MFFLLKVSLFGNPSSENVKMEVEMSSRGVEKQIKKLREAGIIKRIGADYGGHWEIITSDKQ